jgi:alcohol dehydrogenase
MSDMYALTAIENVGKYLPRAVKNGNDMEAREGMAFANTLSGVVMTLSLTTAEHSLDMQCLLIIKGCHMEPA